MEEQSTIFCPPIFRPLFIAFVIAAVVAPAARSQTISVGSAASAVTVRSHGDERSVDVEEELRLLRTANRGLAGSVPRQPMTFPAALARVRELARSAGGAAGLTTALKALPDNEPFTLRLLAMRELAQGRPTAALLLLLAAYDRDPSSPDALADEQSARDDRGTTPQRTDIPPRVAKRATTTLASSTTLTGYCETHPRP